MAGPLLQTKLFTPRRRAGSVQRPRLREQLDRAATARLTLVSAPAGFGKTTLLADWLAEAPPDQVSTAWLSLEPADDDPAIFWPYVIAALRSAAPSVGEAARPLLESSDTPARTLLAAVLNELSSAPSEVILVLDDYHVIGSREIHEGVAFVLDHLPPQLRVAMATRVDPPLPLARLRARGELVEIRAADLRFTADEAGAYLNGAMGLTLDPPDVDVLEARTEGWIAALQLAALSMQGSQDPHGFIAGFAGDDRYIVDYLVEEVLQRQPPSVRDFLLQTSILDRLTGPLCDAVTGQDGGRTMLEALDRANLFVVPLDDRRRWYRYHRLFADVLQARLVDEQPDRVADLHRRASEWLERDGERPEAIRHALAGRDFERAADLIEPAIAEMRRSRQENTLRTWFEALPEDLFATRPVLSIGYVGALMASGRFERIDPLLDQAERLLDRRTDARGSDEGPAGMVVIDEAEFTRLPAAIAMYRAAQARILGDVPGTMIHARRVLDLVAEEDHLGRGAGAALLALACWTTGDLDAARRHYAEAMASLERAGHLSDVIGCAIALADIQMAQGRLGEAMSTYERGLAMATPMPGTVLRGAADMHIGISEILCERDDLAGAARHARLGWELGEEKGLPQNPYRSRVAMARIRRAEGDPDGALELLEEAERLYFGDFSPDVRPVAAVRARALLAQGRLSEAWDWARTHHASADDEPSYLREFEHATLARLLFAQGSHTGAERDISAAVALTERLLAAAREGGRDGSVIDILVVQALARHARGEVAEAVSSIVEALALAEPQGYVRVFTDEGTSMAALLGQARKRTSAGYVDRLLAAFPGVERRATARQPLIEPLSERELEVLRLLQGELDGPAIAAELFVSLNTLRTHTKNIYSKLGVGSRRAAVSRAAELGLLSHTGD